MVGSFLLCYFSYTNVSDKLQLNFGLHNIYYVFNPGKIKPNSPESGFVETQLIKKYANENAVSINFRENQAVRTSIFGIVPAITYNFKF